MSTTVTSQRHTEGALPAPEFSFLTSHAKTLLLIAHDPRIRMRDIAGLLGNPGCARRCERDHYEKQNDTMHQDPTGPVW